MGALCSAHAVVLHLCLFLHIFFVTCFARDDLTLWNLITDSNSETLVSPGAKFELGFFGSGNDQSIRRRYVGIWYHNISTRTVVWVANRDFPLNDFSGVLALNNGNVQVLDGEAKSYWSTELNSSTSVRTAKLLNSGNFILVDDVSGDTLWESFKNPTDTFLPGMEMNDNLALTSWNSIDDPTVDNFTFQKYQQDRYIIRKNSVPYWVSGTSGMYVTYNEIPALIISMLSNVSTTFLKGSNVSAPALSEYNYARLVMTVAGTIEFYIENINPWSAPQDRCSIDNACGNFGSCNVENGLLCRCLPGFSPSSPDNWESGDFSGGCVQKQSSCEKNATFLSLEMMKIKSLETVDARKGKSESDCKNDCLQDCKCLAYSYAAMDIRNIDTRNDPRCWIWRQELSDLQEQYTHRNNTLNVRVALSDLGSTSRNCKPCGTSLVPYPLSTGAECGDPSYISFICDISTRQLSFRAKSTTFPVLSINTTTASFIIQVVEGNRKYCDARGNRLQLDKPSPFHVINYCYQSEKFSMSRGKGFIDIGWDAPLQPLCTQLSDCQEWKNSSCVASHDLKKRCHCNSNFRWDGLAVNCIQVGGNITELPPLPPAEGQRHRERRLPLSSVIIYATVAAIVMAAGLSCSIVFFIYKRKTTVARLQGNQRSQSLQLYGSETRAMRMIQSDQFSENDKRSIEVPFFELGSIIAATDNFSDENKLGRGGFGPVYKGVFPGNRLLAIKMLASASGQGMDEFKNEIVLISRLQHRNLVRLVGYCVTKEVKMLLYEYMPNKSLDYFIFDRALSMQLNWDIRFSIIVGIARGLLYLHEDSRLKIIHRDLKLSNILLDEELNPKISDFGLARIFDNKQTEAITGRVVGTYGYMSPEYALEGFFSVKSDVFSFGVMILEIISGRRNTGFYNSDQALSLLGFAWKLWTERLALDLMDRELFECCKKDEYMKCMQIGLMCVQEDPKDRPIMSTVVRMLGSEITSLPAPKHPAFILARGIQSSLGSSSSNNQKSNSSNKLTLSAFEGR